MSSDVANSSEVNDPRALTHRGIFLLQQGKLAEGVELLQASLTQSPSQLDAALNSAAALHFLGRLPEALQTLEAVSVFYPEHTDLLNNRAAILQGLGLYEASLQILDQALLIRPDFAGAYFNRANALKALERFEEAIIDYDQALQLNPQDAEGYNNCGIALQFLMQCELALACFDQALVLDESYVDALSNRGVVLQDLMRVDEALENFNQALSLNPNYVQAKWNKALLLILLGDYREGWRLHESRWQRKDYPAPPLYSQPMWLGQTSIEGKRLLIHPEQGLGDFVQFCRYGLVLAKQRVKVLLAVPKSLLRLMKSLPKFLGDGVGEAGSIELVELGQGVEFDYYCPSMSLPYAMKTELASIPCETPYLFAAEEAKLAWSKRLGPKMKLRVGLVWSGSTTHKNDHNRSLGLDQLLPLFEQSELQVEFHCLQKEIREADQELLARLVVAGKLQVHADSLVDFADTAGLVELMDVVVSVDTSVAHLAGAMGKSVWILLPYMPDHRWMLERSDSPWYPTAVLYRQIDIQNWDSVIESVQMDLRSLFLSSPNLSH